MNTGELVGEQRITMVFQGAALLLRVDVAEKTLGLRARVVCCPLIPSIRSSTLKLAGRAGTCDSWHTARCLQGELYGRGRNAKTSRCSRTLCTNLLYVF